MPLREFPEPSVRRFSSFGADLGGELLTRNRGSAFAMIWSKRSWDPAAPTLPPPATVAPLPGMTWYVSTGPAARQLSGRTNESRPQAGSAANASERSGASLTARRQAGRRRR
jgi:hypothetical protein